MHMGRVVFLVDMNAFFISCESTRNPALKGRPAAVAGDPKSRRGIILAANYEARKYGIRTAMPVYEARKLCRDVMLVPPDHGFYEQKSQEVMKILSEYSPVIQQNSIDEAWMDMTGCEALFGAPIDTAGKIMKDIVEKLDLWCSIGISDNKFLAKMASEMKKPLGITTVWSSEVRQKIWPLRVREMYGIGKQTEKKLSDLAIYTIGDIARCDANLLLSTFGKYGEELHMLANGIDNSPVVPGGRHDIKSISRSTTLAKDVTDIDYAKAVILRLAEEVGADARRSGCRGKTVTLSIKYCDFHMITRQKSIDATFLTRNIYRAGMELLEENWNPARPVRLLGIGMSNFSESSAEQLSIFDMPGSGEKASGTDSAREERLERVIDNIREKYGSDKVKRAKNLG